MKNRNNHHFRCIITITQGTAAKLEIQLLSSLSNGKKKRCVSMTNKYAAFMKLTGLSIKSTWWKLCRKAQPNTKRFHSAAIARDVRLACTKLATMAAYRDSLVQYLFLYQIVHELPSASVPNNFGDTFFTKYAYSNNLRQTSRNCQLKLNNWDIKTRSALMS